MKKRKTHNRARSSELVRRRPATWEKLTGFHIHFPGGWRADGQSFYKPVTRAEWNRRQMMSICIYVEPPNGGAKACRT